MDVFQLHLEIGREIWIDNILSPQMSRVVALQDILSGRKQINSYLAHPHGGRKYVRGRLCLCPKYTIYSRTMINDVKLKK